MTGDDLERRIVLLEREVERLTAEREIRELITRYCYLADTKQDEQLLELFTEDAEMLAVAGGVEQGSRGRDRIREQIVDPRGHHRPDLYGQGMHLLGLNVVVDFDGSDVASASSYSLLVLKRGEELVLFSASSNHWSLRRDDGHWHIAARRRRPIADADFGAVLLGTNT